MAMALCTGASSKFPSALGCKQGLHVWCAEGGSSSSLLCRLLSWLRIACFGEVDVFGCCCSSGSSTRTADAGSLQLTVAVKAGAWDGPCTAEQERHTRLLVTKEDVYVWAAVHQNGCKAAFSTIVVLQPVVSRQAAHQCSCNMSP
jgi:hypothetical protein